MRIIFHYPSSFDPMPKSASTIRPLMMLEAFRTLGYSVDVVAGSPSERRNCIKNIKKNISNEVKYSFMYSESTTWPTYMPQKKYLSSRPCFDFGLFKYLKIKQIPIGLFYRDIYWLFPNDTQHVPFIKLHIARQLYKYDLRQYQKYLSILYLPSIEMASYIPILSKEICSPLPPGHSVYKKKINYKKIKDHNLTLLYVGGIGADYQMPKLFNLIRSIPEINLFVCTRREEWENVKHEYPNPLPKNIKVIHNPSEKLHKLYAEADVALLFVPTFEYWSFTAPFKIYEYLGERKPIIVSKGTLASKFVEENNIGWSVPYDENSLHCLLRKLLENRSLIKEKILACNQISNQHTWVARAKKVEKELTAINKPV